VSQGSQGSEIGHPCFLVSLSYPRTWICHGRDPGFEAAPLAGERNTILDTEFIVWVEPLPN
jgi:hypothetical protein